MLDCPLVYSENEHTFKRHVDDMHDWSSVPYTRPKAWANATGNMQGDEGHCEYILGLRMSWYSSSPLFQNVIHVCSLFADLV